MVWPDITIEDPPAPWGHQAVKSIVQFTGCQLSVLSVPQLSCPVPQSFQFLTCQLPVVNSQVSVASPVASCMVVMGPVMRHFPSTGLVASPLAASLVPQAQPQSPSENRLQIPLPPSYPKWSQMVPKSCQNGAQKSSNRQFLMKLWTLILYAIYDKYLQKGFPQYLWHC